MVQSPLRSLCLFAPLFVCLYGYADAQTVDTKGPSHPVIVVIGSSTAAGSGARPIDSAWVWLLTAYVHRSDSLARVVNLAVPGYTTYHLLPTGNSAHEGRPAPDPEHNITRALTFTPDVLIINLPSNDANNGYPVREQLANYDVIRAQITNPGTLLFVSTTQPRNIPDAAGRKVLIEMRDSTYARFGSRTMDFWTGLGDPDGSLKILYDSGDGIHMNNLGHRILFERAKAAGILAFVGAQR